MNAPVSAIAAIGLAVGLASQVTGQCVRPIKFGPTTLSGAIKQQSQVDCYWFMANQGDLVRLNSSHDGNRILLVADVLDANRKQVAFKSERQQRIEFRVPSSGMYFIQLRDRDRWRQGTYQLQIRRLNNPVGYHELCYSLQATSGSVRSAATEECYRFSAKKGAKVRATKVWDGNRILLVAEILDSAGKQLAYGNERTQTFEFTPPADGIYWLYVRDRDLWRVNPYTIQLTCLAADCGCAAVARTYGQGHPGTGGRVPTLTAAAPPRLGQTLTLRIGNSSRQAGARAVLAIGNAETNSATAFGGRLFVAAHTVAALALPAGGLVYQAPIPNIPALFCDLCLHVQVVQVDRGASHGLAFSPGLNLIFGR